MAQTDNLVLSAHKIVCGYGKITIVFDGNVDLQMQQIVCIIGPNGAGKSTLLKAIFKLIPIQSGVLKVHNKVVNNYTPTAMVANGIGYVPQINNIFSNLSIVENLELGAFTVKGNISKRMKELFELFPDLAVKPNKSANVLSGGQRQALAICRALMASPQILILDEPSAALSPKLVKEVFNHILKVRESGVSVLMVEQNARAALEIADIGCVMVDGKSIYTAPAQEVLNNPEVAQMYLGKY